MKNEFTIKYTGQGATIVSFVPKFCTSDGAWNGPLGKALMQNPHLRSEYELSYWHLAGEELQTTTKRSEPLDPDEADDMVGTAQDNIYKLMDFAASVRAVVEAGFLSREMAIAP